MVGLDTPLGPVVGSLAKLLEASFGMRTVEDLLRHYPRRYDRRGELSDIGSLRTGELVTLFAEIRSVTARDLRAKTGKRLHKMDVVIADRSGRTLELTFFNQRWRQRDLLPGRKAYFAGRVEIFNKRLKMTNPEPELDDDGDAAGFAGAFVPNYPAPQKVTTTKLRRAVRAALAVLDDPGDPLPEDIRRQYHLVALATALRDVHEPREDADQRRARHRLAWDEAMLLQVTLAQRRRRAATGAPAVSRPARPGGLLAAFDDRLPFPLTAGQLEVGAVLTDEVARTVPMHRLLQGEVGSGKTVVALRAMLQVVDAGGQAALLAPTEVLAAQHLRSLRQLLGTLAEAGMLGGADTATRVALLTGSLSAAARRAALLEAASGQAGIVVGTHALLEEEVQFAELGLVVIDEQHRFGVEQRDALRAKGQAPPHLLVMTATPIPRTVAMTVYGDLETSTLTELPRGRSPIQTLVVPLAEQPGWLPRVWERVREEVAKGGQVYVVCPRIGEGAAEEEAGDEPPPDDDGARPAGAAVTEQAPRLAEGPLAGLRVEALHGRMDADLKDSVMRRFSAGEVDVLVATTVIEVGVDVPAATAMVVLDADRFGISQLHQLRGRVGRGSAASVCLLLSESPVGSPSRERLDAVAATSDGFALARLDLVARREGDVLGAAQSGRRGHLRLLSLLRHEDLIGEARTAAARLVDADPELAGLPALRAAVAALDADRAEFLEKA